MTLQRYSEKRLEDSFDVFLLFSEPFQFRVPDVIDAIEEEFPGLGEWFNPLDDKIHDTGDVVMGFFKNEAEPSEGMISFFSTPGSLPKDGHHDDAINRAFAFDGAWDAWNAHTSHLTLSIKSEGTDLASRFKAARMVTCAAAVLAADPTCVGIMFPSGDVFASPEHWRSGAKEAAANQWPMMAWFSYQVTHFAPPEPDGAQQVSCGAIGMAAFNGHEVAFAAASVKPTYAVSYVHHAMYLLLAGGNRFRDGDTLGLEGGDERLRIRYMEEGPDAQTDSWILLHPSCAIDEIAMFGERANPPPPPGLDNSRMPKEGFMNELLGGGVREDATPPSDMSPQHQPPPAASGGGFGKRKPSVVPQAPEPDPAGEYRRSMRPETQAALKTGHVSLEEARSRHLELVEKINAQVRDAGGSDLKWTPICPSACRPGELADYLLDEIGLDPFLRWNILYFAADRKTAVIFDTVEYDEHWEGLFDDTLSETILQSKKMWLDALADHHKTGDDKTLIAVRHYIRVQLNEATLAAYKHVIGDRQDHIQHFFAVAP